MRTAPLNGLLNVEERRRRAHSKPQSAAVILTLIKTTPENADVIARKMAGR
jgi:hypothetical protein